MPLGQVQLILVALLNTFLDLRPRHNVPLLAPRVLEPRATPNQE